MVAIFTYVSDYLVRQSWQIALVFLLVAAACWLLRRTSAHWRYLLWLAVLAKCLAPPLLTVSLPLLPADGDATRVQPQTGPVPAPDRTPDSPLAAVPLPPPTPEPNPSVADSPGIASPVNTLPDASARSSLVAAQRYTPLTLTPGQWVSLVWLIGLSLYLLIAAGKAWRIHRSILDNRQPLDPHLQDEIVSLAHRLGLRKAPAVCLLDGIAQPFVWGVFRGSICLPADFADVDSPQHRRSILMHELAHVMRCDAAVNLLQVLLQAVFFFHPLVWWANRKIRQEREKCCDEMAIANLEATPRQYGEAIVASLIREYESVHIVSSLAVAGPVKSIEERIETIMNPRSKFRKSPSVAAILVAGLVVAIAGPSSIVLTARGQGSQASSSQPAATQAGESNAFGDTVMGLEAYPSLPPDQLVAACKADLLSDKWHSQDGEFTSLTLRNPAPQREARLPVHKHLPATADQTSLLLESRICYATITGHDDENVTVDATVFVRTKAADTARAFAEQIQVELTADTPYIRLGDHFLKFKTQDIEEAGVIYNIGVPRRFFVDAHVPNGRICVQDITGGLTTRGGGSTIVDRVSGPIRLHRTGGTLPLANLTGKDQICLRQPSGPIAILNVSAPFAPADLGSCITFDLRKEVPAKLDLQLNRGWANVVIGRNTVGNLDITASEGVIVHQPDGSEVQAPALIAQLGQDTRSLKIRMVAGKVNVWSQVQLDVPAQKAEGIKPLGGLSQPGKEQDRSPFTAALSSGGTVSLVGISKHPSAGSVWWQPVSVSDPGMFPFLSCLSCSSL